MRDERKQTLLTRRKRIRRHQNRRRAILPGSAWKVPYLLSMWVRCRGGAKLNLALGETHLLSLVRGLIRTKPMNDHGADGAPQA